MQSNISTEPVDVESILRPVTGTVRDGIIRRREIRDLLAKGLTNNQICGELNISSQALNRHLKKIRTEDEQSEGAA